MQVKERGTRNRRGFILLESILALALFAFGPVEPRAGFAGAAGLQTYRKRMRNDRGVVEDARGGVPMVDSEQVAAARERLLARLDSIARW